MSADTEDRVTATRRRRAASQATANAQAELDGAMRKGNEKDATSSVPAAPVQKPVASRADSKKAAQRAATEQAERDARVKADATPLVTLPQGRPLTLHEQNLIARARDREMRDVARDAGRAAGKAAFEVLAGRVGPDAVKNRRFKNIAAAERAMVDAQRRAAGTKE